MHIPPDVTPHPHPPSLYDDTWQVQSYAYLAPSDCFYLPNGWHHHVFSEADPDGGYNLALNLWISREATLGGVPPRPDYKKERFPTIKQVGRALQEIEPRDWLPGATTRAECAADGSCAPT